jgi:hypothetical protein
LLVASVCYDQDVCHQLHSQYPQPDWNLAWAFTIARESVNPVCRVLLLYAMRAALGDVILADAVVNRLCLL